MKKIAGIVLALGLLVGCAPSTANDNIQAEKVTRVIDGDTIEMESGQKVRILGIDTTERGCPNYLQAKQNMQKLVLDKRVVLVTDGKQTTDRYGRLLRYVDLGDKDIGLEQIKAGLADARYDSQEENPITHRHEYPKHSREDKYHEADKVKNPPCTK